MVAIVVVRFAAIEVAVEVTTCSMPPMSLVMRDCTSPVRVRVKKPIDCRCRWANTSTRSRCMTRCPTVVEIQVCTTPRTALTAATATMPATSHTSRRRSDCGRATSITSRSRNGMAMPRTEVTTMSSTTTASCRRWARNRAPMRRSDTERAWAFSAAETSLFLGNIKILSPYEVGAVPRC
jgi:hypothetical protein